MKELNISVVILTYNEELHIRRCIENIAAFVKSIFIIDSFSTDRTLAIAEEYKKVTILQHKWENNYAKQLNWGLEHAPITTEWVLRLDADEYLTSELINELQQKLETEPEEVTGIIFKRRHYFMDKWMKRGIYPVKLLRVFRYNAGKCESRLMDEHIQLFRGHAVEYEYDFVDHNLNNLSWFCHKHIDYAIREAVDLLDIEYNLTGAAATDNDKNISEQAINKRKMKHKYVRQPLFWRAFFYFCYRYFLKGAFLDGKVGFIWTFIQGWWYRTLVDAKVFELKRLCGDDKKKMIETIEREYRISLTTENK